MARRVLLVEDSFGDRLLMRDVLMEAGCHVVGEAKSFEEMMEKYPNLRPDIVMIDAAIPSNDGVSAVIKLLHKDADATVLIAATRGQRMLAMEGLRAGAKDFVTKPLNVRQLRRVLQGIGA